jgi:hypothetical protein|uniref:Uncharacterized protein n=1 Tax=Zea mays TaxID=4577 RepID=A0A804P880_MAIZE
MSSNDLAPPCISRTKSRRPKHEFARGPTQNTLQQTSHRTKPHKPISSSRQLNPQAQTRPAAQRATYHLVDDVDGVAEVGCLEPGGRERGEQPLESDGRVVEVGAGDPREPRLVERLRRLEHDGAHALQRLQFAASRTGGHLSSLEEEPEPPQP